jgi:hypothetical protein
MIRSARPVKVKLGTCVNGPQVEDVGITILASRVSSEMTSLTVSPNYLITRNNSLAVCPFIYPNTFFMQYKSRIQLASEQRTKLEVV